MDTCGVFGDWGKPSGVNDKGIPYGNNVFDSHFEMDFTPTPSAEMIKRQLREIKEVREVKIDNTYVAPRILFKKN